VLRIEEPPIIFSVEHKFRIKAADRLFGFVCESAALDHFFVQLIRVKANLVWWCLIYKGTRGDCEGGRLFDI
jgi:hypothetical protein